MAETGIDAVGPDAILDFWFAAGPDRWFKKDVAFDREIAERFGGAHAAAAAGKLDSWRDSARGALALIILLDQFPRNMFRDTPQAFATDEQALAVAEAAVTRGFDKIFPLPERRFFYMPFMHAEDPAMQRRCVELCEKAGDKEGLKHARIHADIVDLFGRFPHRNPILGRKTTADEERFLDEGGFAG